MGYMEAKMQERYDAADDEMRLRQSVGVQCPDCGGSGAIIHMTGGGLEYEDVAERCSTCEGFGLVKPTCERCDGAGWIEGRDHADGSSGTSRPCPKCSGRIVTD